MSDIEDQFRELERIKRREARKHDSPVSSWKNKQEVREYLAQLRLEERESILPKDRVCPRCLGVHLNPRSWVILVDGKSDQSWRSKLHTWQRRRRDALLRALERGVRPPERSFPFSAICRSCYSMRRVGDPEVFLQPMVFWKVDSKKLKVARFQSGLTGTEVADFCGWSQAKQSKIESRDCLLPNSEVLLLMECLNIDRPSAEEDVRKYRLDGPALQRARNALGISRRVIADCLDVSISRVRHLETRQSIVEERIANSLVSVLKRIDSAED